MTEDECTEAMVPLKRVQYPTAEEGCSENDKVLKRMTIFK